MRHRTRHDTTIVCIHSLRDYAGQVHFSGVLDFCHRRTNWAIRHVDPDDLDEATARRIVKSRPDGVIITLPGTPAAMKTLFNASLPIVIANVGGCRLSPKNRRVSFVWTDNADIGEKGARFLLSAADFNAYAFADAQGSPFWSRERGRAFREELRKKGKACLCHAHDEPSEEWLTALPKPAAVMAANDMRAAEIIETCLRKGIRVPEDVAVLGVDNEPGLRNHFQPKISSIPVDFLEMGIRETEELDRLISNPRARGNPEILIPAGDVIARQSTRKSADAADLVRKIRDYIVRNAHRRISVTDAIQAIGCSRRLAELRFRQITGTSIRRELEKVRLSKAADLIHTTNMSETDIAAETGFFDQSHLTRVFKKERGMTPGEYRRRHHQREVVSSMIIGST